MTKEQGVYFFERTRKAEEERDAARAEVAALKAGLVKALGLGDDGALLAVDDAWAALPASVCATAIAAVADAVGPDAYDCVRTWSAWGVGTMGEDDFIPVTEDSDRVAQIAREVTIAILSAVRDVTIGAEVSNG